jgi:hypothetical protein
MTHVRFSRHERGAALILTVVVVMILTTLGIAMVSFTGTEERTAVAYRDSLQARILAEAGVRMVEEMFRTPTDRQLVPLYNAAATAAGSGWDYWGANEAAVEAVLNARGIWRSVRPGASTARYTGNNNGFFQGPFRDDWAQVFGGTFSTDAALDVYDIKFNCTNPSTGVEIANANTQCWLRTELNGDLLQDSTDWNLDTGEITDITFYAPPQAGGRSYGLSTVRVTAEKRDEAGMLLARETLVAVIGDNASKPAVLGNGDIVFKTSAGQSCGDGCEQIHANGNATVGTVSGGTDPIVTATGSVNGTASTKPAITAPHINPWDLTYKPATTEELGKYYLLARRALDAVWTNGTPSDNPASRPCGFGGWAECQDYNLEYDTAGVEKLARTAADTPHYYKWNNTSQGWTLCDSGTSLDGGAACPGAPSWSVSRAADFDPGATTDDATIPFHVRRVPKTVFTIDSAEDGATVLIDGGFHKSGSMNAEMSVIAVGSIHLHSSTTWMPALTNRAMWISGRDIYMHSNCCAPSNTCATNLGTPQYAGIIAAHEQIYTHSQNALLGLIIAEHRVNHDDKVDSNTLAINSDKGDHGSICNLPDWPWALPVRPTVLSMVTAAQ